MNPQLEGLSDLEGTYPFDLRAAMRTMRLNRFLWSLVQPERRQAFGLDEEAEYTRAGLTPAEADFVRRRDWIGMIRYGVNFFVLEKLARVVKVSNLEVYAEFRGEGLEEFMATRQVPNAR